MTLDPTRLLSAHAYDPYLRSGETGIVPAHLTGANTALDTYLGGEPLTAEVLSEIVVAGCRALARQNADATVLALQDTRDALALERDTLRRELDAAKSSMTTEVATTANRVTEHANAVLGTMNAKVVEVTSGLPAHTRDTVAPLLDSLLQQFSSGLLAASKQMLDVSNPNSVTNGLAVSVDRAMTTHTERVSARLGELETRLGVADARAEEREKSSAKGFDFEDALEIALGEYAESSGLVLLSTGREEGLVKGSKKGDFVFRKGDMPLVVIEAKNRASSKTSPAQIHRDLDETQRNRDTPVAVWVVNGLAQNDNKFVRFLSDTRWAVAFDGDSADMLSAVLRFAAATAERLRSGTGSGGDLELARAKVSEALTAAEDLGQVQKLAADMVTAANSVSNKVIAVRTRISTSLIAAADALSRDTSALGV